MSKSIKVNIFFILFIVALAIVMVLIIPMKLASETQTIEQCLEQYTKKLGGYSDVSISSVTSGKDYLFTTYYWEDSDYVTFISDLDGSNCNVYKMQIRRGTK